MLAQTQPVHHRAYPCTARTQVQPQLAHRQPRPGMTGAEEYGLYEVRKNEEHIAYVTGKVADIREFYTANYGQVSVEALEVQQITRQMAKDASLEKILGQRTNLVLVSKQ